VVSVNPQRMIARKAFPADDLKGLVASTRTRRLSSPAS